MLNFKNWINKTLSTLRSRQHTIINNYKTNYNVGQNKESKIICTELVNVEKCDTEGRQKIIKKLIKNSHLDLSNDIQNEILDCSSEIDECELEGGYKRLKVITLLDDGCIYTLGYIPKGLEQKLYTALDKADKYSTNLYVTKIDKFFNLKIEIIYTKEY